MWTKEQDYLEKLVSAIDKLKSINYNDKKDTESKVVDATNDLIGVRDDMQEQVDQFDSWANLQSNMADSMSIEEYDEEQLEKLDPVISENFENNEKEEDK